MPGSRAYQLAGYSARGNSAEVNASRLLRKAQVRARIEQLLGEAAQHFLITKGALTAMLLQDRALAHRKGQALAAATITVRLGQLRGFAFDPSKDDKVSAPPSRPEPKPINFRELNEIFSRLPVHPQAAEHVGDALHPQAAHRAESRD